MKVELYYFEGCPNYDKAAEILQLTLKNMEIDIPIDMINIEDDETAKTLKFIGSPSIRIDDKDVDPTQRDNTDYSLRCRIYRTDNGVMGWPPPSMIADALAEAKKHDKSLP